MGSHDCRLSLQQILVREGNHEAIDKLAPLSVLSPGLLGGLRGQFVPFEPVGDAMHMNVYTNAHVSVQDQASSY